MSPTMTRINKNRENFTYRMISKVDAGNFRVKTPLNTSNTGSDEESFQDSSNKQNRVNCLKET